MIDSTPHGCVSEAQGKKEFALGSGLWPSIQCSFCPPGMARSSSGCSKITFVAGGKLRAPALGPGSSYLRDWLRIACVPSESTQNPFLALGGGNPGVRSAPRPHDSPVKNKFPHLPVFSLSFSKEQRPNARVVKKFLLRSSRRGAVVNESD